MMKKYKISAVVLSRNSAGKIEKCLASLAGWADEIIVVDGESTDDTAKIAVKFGARLHSHKFLGAFSAERNFGSDKAAGEWVLQLDSDEIVSDEFKRKCDEVLPATHCAAFKFRRKNVFLGHEFRYGGWYHWSQHLFRKGMARYEGRVHEKMLVDGEVGYIDADILHIPFDSISEFIERQNRYTDLQAADIIDQEGDLGPGNVRYNLRVKPVRLFRKIYFNKKGYREGLYGLIFAALSSWVHFLKWAKVWERTRERANILVIRNDRFGEFLLNIPAIRALKERFRDSKIVLAVDPHAAGLAERIPYADEVISWKMGKHRLPDIVRFSRVLKKKRFGMAFMMNPSKDSNLAVFFAGIPRRIGYAHKWDFLLTDRIEDKKGLGIKHEVEYNLDLVRAAGADTEDLSLILSVDDAAPGLAGADGRETWFERAIAIHPWTSDAIKQWPEERFKELALRIVRELGAEVIIVGDKGGRTGSAVFDKLGGRIHNMTGRTSLIELASLLKKCRLLISGDSGPVHLASCVGTPVIALFRNDMPGKGPKRWGPRGSHDIVIEKKDLREISVDEVMNRIRECKDFLLSIHSV